MLIGKSLKVVLAGAALVSAAPAPDRSMGWTPDAIPWQRAAANGTRFSLLEGQRERPGGSFTYAFAIPAGVWDSPHRHSSTARVFVTSGALSIGYGTAADHAKAVRYPAGSVVVVPAGAWHFDGSDVDTVIVGVAQGPWSTVYLDRSLPASAGTPIAR